MDFIIRRRIDTLSWHLRDIIVNNRSIQFYQFSLCLSHSLAKNYLRNNNTKMMEEERVEDMLRRMGQEEVEPSVMERLRREGIVTASDFLSGMTEEDMKKLDLTETVKEELMKEMRKIKIKLFNVFDIHPDEVVS